MNKEEVSISPFVCNPNPRRLHRVG